MNESRKQEINKTVRETYAAAGLDYDSPENRVVPLFDIITSHDLYIEQLPKDKDLNKNNLTAERAVDFIKMENRGGELRRGFAQVERVVTMDTSPFPWEEVETFALALRKHDLRLLAANKLEENFSFDFEKTRRAANWRST